MPHLYKPAFLFLLLLSFRLHAQQIKVSGHIVDSLTNDPVRYASVTLDKFQNTLTGEDGSFSFTINPGSHLIQVTCIGYRSYSAPFGAANEPVMLTIPISGHQSQLNQVVVSSSRQQTQLAREVVSMTVIQPYLINNTNSRDLSDVLNRVPGVSVVDGQATMRGGVGYSYNVGSRVTVLLDDMPLMGPDVGDVQWKFLPIESAEQIEVTQGASSALYGSSAMNGTINVRSGWSGPKPETRISLYQGLYDDPERKQIIWWDRTSQPFFSGGSFVHRQTFGQLDLVCSGNVMGDHSYLQQNDEFRARTYIKTRYRFKKVEGLSVGVNTNVMLQKAGRFFLWKDIDSVLLPFGGSAGQDFYRIFSIDPHVTWQIDKTFSMALKMRYYNIRRYVDQLEFPGQNDAVAQIYALDYNIQKSFLKHFHSTSGTYLTRSNSVGNVYQGQYAGYTAAMYTQVSYERKRWTLVAGLRYELNALGEIQMTTKPLKRFGVNFQAAKQTFLRFSYGEGYRFATVAERYVHDQIGDSATRLIVAPNPNLQSETGWTSEIGIKQGFRIGNFYGYADFSVFVSQYQNLIDFRFGQIEDAAYVIDTPTHTLKVLSPGVIGFRAYNIGETRTGGFELSLSGEGKIWKDLMVRTLAGFTYAYPVSLDSLNKYSLSYMDGFMKSFSGIDSIEKLGILPYRNRILGKFDIELTYKRFSIGYGMFYYSQYDNVDKYLSVFVKGLDTFRNNRTKGDLIHNVRVAYRITPNLKWSFLVNNLTNEEYATRPAKIDPLRNYTMQIVYVF